MSRVCCFLLALAACLSGRAEVLLNDSFDYSDGSLVTVSSGQWVHHSGSTTGEMQVAAGRALLDDNDHEDVNSLLADGPYSTSTNLTLYVGFTVRFTSLPGSGENYFAHFKDGGSGYAGKSFATTSGATSGTFRLGITERANSGAAYPGTDLSLFTDYRVVVRYDVSTAASTIWIDPTSESDASATATDTSSSGINVEAFALRETGNGGNGTLELDDLVVATTFAEVTGGSPPEPPPSVPALSLLDYNVAGNSVADWSTNSAQVQAIGREIDYLDPDIITFQEIPLTNTWQMANFVTAFRPGYYLATNSGTDGYIRSTILSRYPIVRSQSWLDGADLRQFGYTNSNPYLDNFTRDLFEAELDVPWFPRHVHVFTTHLKAGSSDADSAARRAAEASAISNFFVNTFLPTKSDRPYVLTGDMNEDVSNPSTGSQHPIQRLVSTPTGLQLTTPVNPYTSSERTWSIRGFLGERYDYILPGGLLYSNIVSSEVFRTDLLSMRPPPLLSGDSATASDHLPVFMVFRNPFDVPFRMLSATTSNNWLTVTWESIPGASYDLEGSANLTSWSVVAANLTATGTNESRAISAGDNLRWVRVRRLP